MHRIKFSFVNVSKHFYRRQTYFYNFEITQFGWLLNSLIVGSKQPHIIVGTSVKLQKG